MRRLVSTTGLLLLLPALSCSSSGERERTPLPADAFPWAALASLPLSGVPGYPDTVQLVDGRWEGEPFAEEAASRPELFLVPDFRLVGDWDADGKDEAALLVSESSGGSGAFLYLIVVEQADGTCRQTGIAPVGDRVEIRAASSQSEEIVLEVVQAGGADPMCCPGDLATRRWRYTGDALQELPLEITGRLTPAAMSGRTWVLTHWDTDEPLQGAVTVTLEYVDGQMNGSSGCNRYTVAVQPGEMPGDLTLGPMAGTLRACEEPVMAVEDRFRALLGSVHKFGFRAGRLALTYESEGDFGTLLLAAESDSSGGLPE